MQTSAEVLEERLRKIVRRLEPLEPRRIVLFGSAARGRTDAFADIDVVVVADAVPERPVLGHSIGGLRARVADSVEGYGELRSEAARLDRCDVPTRYPNGLPAGSDPAEAFTEEDAAEAIGTADRVLRFTREEVERVREEGPEG